MTRDPRELRGTTLVELLVVLSVLGVIASVAVLAVRRFDRPAPNDPRAILAESLRVAVDSSRAIVVRFVRDGRAFSATVRPDGTVVADSGGSLDADRLTGRPSHAR